MHGAALEDEGRVETRQAEAAEQQAGKRRVALVAAVFAAPGIEPPGDAGDPSRPVAHEGRAEVPHPGIVDRRLPQGDRGPAERRRLRGIGFARHHGHGLEPGDRPRHRRIGLACLVDAVAPELGAARPGHPAALVRRPLGRHREPLRNGRIGSLGHWMERLSIRRSPHLAPKRAKIQRIVTGITAPAYPKGVHVPSGIVPRWFTAPAWRGAGAEKSAGRKA